MKTISYQSYTACIEYSNDDQCFVGHIAAIKDRVGFHAESDAELEEAFQVAVDDYLETCAAVGKTPNKPVSGVR